MPSQIMRFSSPKHLRFNTYIVVAVAVGLLTISASANASPFWSGFAASGFTGSESNASSLDIALQQDASAMAKEHGILAVIRLALSASDNHGLVDDAEGDAAAIQSKLATAMIINSGLIMRQTFISNGSNGISVPELGSAVMLGLGVIALAVHAKRRERGSYVPHG